MKVADWIDYHGASTPGRIAVRDIDTNRTLTYAQFDDRVGRLAGALASRHGVGHGDRVMVLAKNRLETLEVLFACLRLGAIFVPVNWRLAYSEIEFICKDAEPRVVVYEAEFGEAAIPVGRVVGAGVVAIGSCLPGTGYDWLIEQPAASGWRPVEVDWEEPWMILYTSGTTGSPKGAMLSYRMMYFNVLNFTSPVRLGSDSAFLCVMPLFHTGGLNCYVTPVFFHGGTVIVMREFDAPLTLSVLTDPAMGVTHFFGVPQIYTALSQCDGFDTTRFPAMVIAGVGGAPASDALVKLWLDKGVPLQPAYGMTEIGPAITITPVHRVLEKLGSSGRPAMNLELRIVDQQGVSVELGAIGEIIVRGPVLMSGYWRNPQRSAEAFQDGWFRTGDAARMDADGFVFIVDRFKDMYISGGENVYPNEVENAISSMPGVVSVAIIGVPDERWGETGCAYIVQQRGAGLTDEALREYCTGRLAKYKIPKTFRFVEELPRTASGKVLKGELRRMHLSRNDSTRGDGRAAL